MRSRHSGGSVVRHSNVPIGSGGNWSYPLTVRPIPGDEPGPGHQPYPACTDTSDSAFTIAFRLMRPYFRLAVCAAQYCHNTGCIDIFQPTAPDTVRPTTAGLPTVVPGTAVV